MSENVLEQSTEDLERLMAILPDSIRRGLGEIDRSDDLLEVVMDYGRRPSARYVDGELILRDEGVTFEEIQQVIDGVGNFDDDNRAGIARTLHRISGMRNRRGDIVGLTCRVGRAVYGTIDIIADLIEDGQSILLLGRPGVGKTTMLREIARVLSENRRVIVVDTSNEIGGDGDIPHPAVGRARRMQVPSPSQQHETMIEAVENHNPEVIIIDEIGREQEAVAARTINERGVQLIGTAHGNSLENLLLNPTLSDLVGGIESVTLSDEEARRRGTQKTVLERRAPPTFDVLIEIQDRQQLAIHADVGAAVDAMLRNRPAALELRYRDEEDAVQVEQKSLVPTSAALTARTDDRGQRNSRPREGVRNGRYEPEPSSEKVASSADREGVSADQNRRQISVYAYGVARNRLIQAAKRLGVRVTIVDNINEAEVLVTLKSYYRRRPRVVDDAQNRRIPIFVLRANTVSQMQNFLAEALNIESGGEDPFEIAVNEAEEAIKAIYSGQQSVDLRPVGSAVRRYQHQLARQADLVSHSYGKEPYRHVRIFNSRRNNH